MEQDHVPDRYVSEGEIARGGMGVILRVNDRNLDRTLAMKRMLSAPEVDGSEWQEVQYARFLEEAQITAQLDHPSIVPVHEMGSDAQGRTYYTMRLVKGRELGDVIREIHTQLGSNGNGHGGGPIAARDLLLG